MNVLTSSFSQASSNVYFAKWARTIEELLVSPLSYFEIMVGTVLSAVARALTVGVVILLVGMLFGAVSMYSLPLFIFYVIGISVIFGLLGIITGLVAKSFEQLNILSTFIIMPFSFLGGMFYTLDMLPPIAQNMTLLNPFFYFVDGVRYAMTGINDANLLAGATLILSLVIVFGFIVWKIFQTGWRIRE